MLEGGSNYRNLINWDNKIIALKITIHVIYVYTTDVLTDEVELTDVV